MKFIDLLTEVKMYETLGLPDDSIIPLDTFVCECKNCVNQSLYEAINDTDNNLKICLTEANKKEPISFELAELMKNIARDTQGRLKLLSVLNDPKTLKSFLQRIFDCNFIFGSL
jgi:hypothetical protein